MISVGLNNPKRPREEYLDAIRDLAEELGRTPRIVDMDERGQFHSSNIRKQLNMSWNEAVAAAGLEPNPQATDGPAGGAKSKFGLEDLDPSAVGRSAMEGDSP